MIEQHGEGLAIALGADGDEKIVELVSSYCRMFSPRIAK
jgi:hypothetical protein